MAFLSGRSKHRLGTMTVTKQVHEIIRVVTMGVLVTTLRQNQRSFVKDDLYKNVLTEYYVV